MISEGYRKFMEHEVNRLLSMTVVLGWELVLEVYNEDGPMIGLKRVIPQELRLAADSLGVVMKKESKES